MAIQKNAAGNYIKESLSLGNISNNVLKPERKERLDYITDKASIGFKKTMIMLSSDEKLEERYKQLAIDEEIAEAKIADLGMGVTRLAGDLAEYVGTGYKPVRDIAIGAVVGGFTGGTGLLGVAGKGLATAGVESVFDTYEDSRDQYINSGTVMNSKEYFQSYVKNVAFGTVFEMGGEFIGGALKGTKVPPVDKQAVDEMLEAALKASKIIDEKKGVHGYVKQKQEILDSLDNPADEITPDVHLDVKIKTTEYFDELIATEQRIKELEEGTWASETAGVPEAIKNDRVSELVELRKKKDNLTANLKKSKRIYGANANKKDIRGIGIKGQSTLSFANRVGAVLGETTEFLKNSKSKFAKNLHESTLKRRVGNVLAPVKRRIDTTTKIFNDFLQEESWYREFKTNSKIVAKSLGEQGLTSTSLKFIKKIQKLNGLGDGFVLDYARLKETLGKDFFLEAGTPMLDLDGKAIGFDVLDTPKLADMILARKSGVDEIELLDMFLDKSGLSLDAAVIERIKGEFDSLMNLLDKYTKGVDLDTLYRTDQDFVNYISKELIPGSIIDVDKLIEESTTNVRPESEDFRNYVKLIKDNLSGNDVIGLSKPDLFSIQGATGAVFDGLTTAMLGFNSLKEPFQNRILSLYRARHIMTPAKFVQELGNLFIAAPINMAGQIGGTVGRGIQEMGEAIGFDVLAKAGVGVQDFMAGLYVFDIGKSWGHLNTERKRFRKVMIGKKLQQLVELNADNPGKLTSFFRHVRNVSFENMKSSDVLREIQAETYASETVEALRRGLSDPKYKIPNDIKTLIKDLGIDLETDTDLTVLEQAIHTKIIDIMPKQLGQFDGVIETIVAKAQFQFKRFGIRNMTDVLGDVVAYVDTDGNTRGFWEALGDPDVSKMDSVKAVSTLLGMGWLSYTANEYATMVSSFAVYKEDYKQRQMGALVKFQQNMTPGVRNTVETLPGIAELSGITELLAGGDNPLEDFLTPIIEFDVPKMARLAPDMMFGRKFTGIAYGLLQDDDSIRENMLKGRIGTWGIDKDSMPLYKEKIRQKSIW